MARSIYMFNVCPKCGEYRADKLIDPAGPYAVCPVCSHPHKFVRLPLFILTGASGTGKTSVCMKLAYSLKEAIVLENDILWRPEFNTPETDYKEYREHCLRLCKNIAQSGKPVVLCGSVVPSQLEGCVERRYFSEIHYMALVCENSVLESRLRSRPSWRQSSSEEFIRSQLSFNHYFYEKLNDTKHPLHLFDTTCTTDLDATESIAVWIRGVLAKCF
jgi:broad-specificity NMP kinase